MFFLVYGEDTFRSRRKLAALRERFSATRDASGLNAAVLRAGDADPEQLAEALFASPFLADRKLVILEGFLGADKETQERVAEMLARKPESTVAIFYEDDGAEALAKSPLLPMLAKQKFTEEFAKLSPGTAERFAIEESLAAGITMRPAVARLLVTAVGADAWLLHQEVAKLSAYAAATGSAEVTEAMVREQVVSSREESIFPFLDACTEGRCADAARMLEELLDAGVAELQVVAMLAKHYRTLVAVHDLVERGERDKNAVARRLGIHPFPAGKAMVAVRNSSATALKKQYEALIEIERGFKTGTKAKAPLGVFLASMA
jgi:DNA polymerase-3 subunit delta